MAWIDFRTGTNEIMLLVWGVAIPRESLQTATVGGLESNGDSGAHAPDSHAFSQMGIPSGIQMSDVIH